MFRTGYVENCCLRCQKTVYPTDKIGPLKDFTFFHSGCFRCVECSTKLTLKTYFNNQVSRPSGQLACFLSGWAGFEPGMLNTVFSVSYWA